MEQIDKSSLEQQLIVSMEENVELSRELLILTRQIHSYMRFAKISAIVQMLLIVAPIAASLFFIPTLMKGLNELSGSLPAQLLQSGGGETVDGKQAAPANLDLNALIKQYKQTQQQR